MNILAVYQKRTRDAFVWSRIFLTPFWAIYGLLPFILRKDLDASLFQIGVITAIKPAVSILSMYWSSSIVKNPSSLVRNIMTAGLLANCPFFFFPFVNSPWFFIFSLGFYMMLHRGVIPAWMELLRLNVPSGSRERLFALCSAFGYFCDAVLPFLYGWLLDGFNESWRWIFPVTALLSMTSLIFQCRILVPNLEKSPERKINRFTLSQTVSQLTAPWKQAWDLMNHRIDFRNFQIGFMLGGSGLMVIQAVLPCFFVDVLSLSYTELMIALTLCKGIGYACTSHLWARWMGTVDIYRFCSVVTLIAALFPVLLFVAPINIAWLYLAYIVYGIMQGGSELGWNLSGPIFSGNDDSSVYTSVNIVSLGLRGLVAPALGIWILSWTSPMIVLGLGGLLCLSATVVMSFYGRSRASVTGATSAGDLVPEI